MHERRRLDFLQRIPLDYLLRRLLLTIPTLFGITLILFVIISLAPGDPAAMRAGEAMNPEVSERIAQQIRERFHLDEPIPVRYWLWIKGLCTFDLGKSMFDELPVVEKVGEAIWPTLKVNLASIFIAFFVSIPIGLFSAARHNGWFDRVSGVLLYMLYSLPSFVGAIILILYLGVRWGLLPFRGAVGDDYEALSWMGKFGDIVSHMAIYLICATYASLAYYSRFVRQNMLEVTRQDFIRTARAKGLPEHVVIIKHAFRNTLIPFITLVGLVVPSLLGGSVILEKLFNWPGLGKLFIESILQRDYPVVMALSTATAVLVLLANLFVDLLYGVVDPRVRQK